MLGASRVDNDLVTVALGGNVGDTLGTLRSAYTALSTLGRIQAVSPLYETVAMVAPGTFSLAAPRYLNGVMQFYANLEPLELLQSLLTIEHAHHRTRDPKLRWGARTLDLDIISYGALRLEQPNLTLPHPEMHRRAFVLRPLCDIDPAWVHPALHKTALELLHALPTEQYPPVRVHEGSVLIKGAN